MDGAFKKMLIGNTKWNTFVIFLTERCREPVRKKRFRPARALSYGFSCLILSINFAVLKRDDVVLKLVPYFMIFLCRQKVNSQSLLEIEPIYRSVSLSVFEESCQCVVFIVHVVSKALDRLCFQLSYRFLVVSRNQSKSLIVYPLRSDLS